MDERYHAAKLAAAAASDQAKLIWEEHEEARRLVLTDPVPAIPRPSLEAMALAILHHQRTHKINAGAN